MVPGLRTIQGIRMKPGSLLPNHNPPTVMHIDMNASFAMAEQQAKPLLRGKPVGVAAYTGPSGCLLSPSYEAKRGGVKTACTVRDARLLVPDLTVLPPDPPKYREVHKRFVRIFRDYSPDVTPKSIDEAVLDLTGTPALKKRGMEAIGQEIKRRMKLEIGCWVTCNVGISTNRFLAKVAAGLHKPDGMDTVTRRNLEQVYASLALTDLPGINTRFEARLNAAGIFTPLEFLAASRETLMKQVFKSIAGHYWYLRLRGWEIDAVDFNRRSFGNSYSLQKQTDDPYELSRLLMKLCEKAASRMRSAGYCAWGVHVAVEYTDHTWWHKGKRTSASIYTTREAFLKAQWILNMQPERKRIRNLAVSLFNVEAYEAEQQTLFETEEGKRRRLSQALDRINSRYGDFVITPALMMGMDGEILDRISFGGVKEMVYDEYA